jgi:CubicO group peptidase (beta-lactamase class C family)
MTFEQYGRTACRKLLCVFVIWLAALMPFSAASGANAYPVALTVEDANAWLDGFFPLILQQEQIAGATVVIVKDGKILTQRGYGFDNIASGRKVDPERSLFRIGSISKLFTWTAVMQLVERGRLDLDRDINEYLDFKIPPYRGKPITMRHLMTHSPGFEESNKYLIVQNPPGKPLVYDVNRYVKDWVPARVYPAGKNVAYSNYGTALAGYIVARRAKISFDDYVEKNILTPLGMTRTSFRQPLPSILSPDMSVGYSSAPREAKPFELVAASPAGSVSSTATDMARFMIAHLQQGRFGNAVILNPASSALMHDSNRSLTKYFSGMALGFYRQDRPDLRIIGHGGDTNWFHSDLFLVQDHNVGVFVSVNSATVKGWRAPFMNGFLDRYFPTELKRSTFKPLPAHTTELVGAYQSNRRTITGPLTFINLLQQFDIVKNEDGTVSGIVAVDDPAQTKWREVDNYLWQEVGGRRQFAALLENGKIASIQLGWIPPVLLFEKVSKAENGSLNLLVLGFAILIFTLSVLHWIGRPMLRRAYGTPGETRMALLQHPLRFPLKLCALAALLGLATMMSVLTLSDTAIDPQSNLIDALLIIGQLLFWIAILGLGVAILNLYKVLRLPQSSWWVKAKAILLLAAFAGMAWFAYSQNLLTFRLTY